MGQVDIAASFDSSWTSARVATEWCLAEGARPVYLAAGFDTHLYRPMDVEKNVSVPFAGTRVRLPAHGHPHACSRRRPSAGDGEGSPNPGIWEIGRLGVLVR